MIAVGSVPRVALIADTFYEVNGAARTCREWEAFARRRRLPFFCARRGAGNDSEPRFREDGPVWTMDIARSRCAYRIDTDLYFDAFFLEALGPITEKLKRFQPDI